MARLYSVDELTERLQALERRVAGLPYCGRWQVRYGLLGAFVLFILLGSFVGGLFLRDGRANLEDGYYRVAYQQYKSQAATGDRHAQTVLGNLYLLGLGVRKDQRMAARWYLKAALAGHVPAQINLGQVYWNGLGVPRTLQKAVGWFHLAKEGGSKRAEGHLVYIGRTNSILPLMYDKAVLEFRTLAHVKQRFKDEGEMALLLE